MPGKGYSTIGLKPAVTSRLQNLTDTFFPGMFLPSTLIILMNEIQLGHYTVDEHKISLDLSGRYNTLTIRSDVKDWLNANFDLLGKEYERKYNIKCFANFVSYFLTNLFESKFDAQNHIIRLKESDFNWLRDEYGKQRTNKIISRDITFERFADSYINEILDRIKQAKKLLTM